MAIELFKDKSVYQYDPTRIQLSWGDAITFNAFSPDTFITLEKVIPESVAVVSGIGNGKAFLTNHHGDYILTISLLSNSKPNRVLTSVYNKFIYSKDPINKWGANIVLQDHNLKLVWYSSFAFFHKAPTAGYGALSGNTSWQLYCTNMIVSADAIAGEHLSTEQILIKKVEDAIQSVGKTISGIFS